MKNAKDFSAGAPTRDGYLKSIIALLLCVIMLLSVSACGAGKTDADAETTNAVTSDTAKSDGTETADYISENEVGKKVSSENLLCIVSKYMTSMLSDISDEAEVPFESVFRYFKFNGCYDSVNGGVREEMKQYFSETDMTFTVPSYIADKYLCDRFNTVADHTVDEYDSEKDAYVFKTVTGGPSYIYDLLGYDFDYANDLYTLDVSCSISLDTEYLRTPQRLVFQIWFKDGAYRFVSVRHAKTVVISADGGKVLSDRYGRIEVGEYGEANAYKHWWLMAADTEGEYTLHPAVDGEKALCIIDGTLVIKEKENWHDSAQTAEFAVRLETADDGTVSLRITDGEKDLYIDPRADSLLSDKPYGWKLEEVFEKTDGNGNTVVERVPITSYEEY